MLASFLKGSKKGGIDLMEKQTRSNDGGDNIELNVFIKTLGCKVNLFDSGVIASKLKALNSLGILINNVSDYSKAQCVIINTCCVTHNAEKEIFYLIRHYRKTNPDLKFVLTGCAISIDQVRSRLEQEYKIDLLIPNDKKTDFESYFTQFVWSNFSKKNPSNSDQVISNNLQSLKKSDPSEILFGKTQTDRQRYFLKIQDGCSSMCSYCIIPYTRGKPKSVDENLLIQEIKRVVNEGISEIVLTGIHVGKYGLEGSNYNLATLINKINELGLNFRLRLSSIEVNELTDELLAVLKNTPCFCNHLHIPMQSGSDRILSLMNRRYSRSFFKDKILQIKEMFDDINIGSDVIVGFCSEEEKDFEDSVDLIKSSNLNYLHVFPYSPRKGTRSYNMQDTNQNIKLKRAKILRELSEDLYNKYLLKHVGTSCQILWETEHEGCSKNYIHVVDKKTHLPGSLSMEVLESVYSQNPSWMEIRS